MNRLVIYNNYVKFFQWSPIKAQKLPIFEAQRVQQPHVYTFRRRLTSSRSDKSLWARSYKNEPIPARLRARILGRKYEFDDNTDSDEEIIAVEEE